MTSLADTQKPDYINKKLSEGRERLQTLVDQIEDRNIQNLADIGEIRYIEWEVATLLNELKMESIDRHNKKLSLWAKNSPAAETHGDCTKEGPEYSG